MGEFELIKQFFDRPEQRQLIGNQQINLGIGDDCALLAPPPGQQLAISTDTLVSGRHFFADAAAEDIGYKSLAVNVSDLAAMGAKPAAFSLALTLPEANSNWLSDFASGLFECADRHTLALVGGDTTTGPLAITITIYGWVPVGNALLRSAAKPGELVVVTGTLGGPAAAVADLKRGSQPDAGWLGDLLRPKPPVRFAENAASLISAAIDISDGLKADLDHILSASQCGAELDLGLLPLATNLPQRLGKVEAIETALTGGDDYQLCLTVQPENWPELVQIAERHGVLLTQVGQVTDSGTLELLLDQQPFSTRSSGYEHFSEQGKHASVKAYD